jgi:CRP/FNR family transcriptional regulator
MTMPLQDVSSTTRQFDLIRNQPLECKIKPHDCHSCDAIGGCLAEKMMEFQGQVDQVRHNSRTYKPSEHIFREGENSTGLYVIKSGSVKLYLTTEDGEEQVLGFYMRGDVVGLDGQEGLPRNSSAIALETTSICKLPLNQLSDRGRGRGYPRLIAEQMARDHNLVLMLARKDADGRLASFLCDLSRRFEKSGYSATAFNLSMSRQDIGSYLGLAIETVSRTLTRFQDGGLLQASRRKLDILGLDQLKLVAGSQASA